MSKVKNEVKFLAFCVEIYKSSKGITGKNAYNYLRRTGATVFIMDCYGALHTTGPLYIVDSIDDFIANNYKTATYSFEEILAEDGLTLADIDAMEDVEIEYERG